MSRQFGMKTCDWCFTVIEGMVGDYCSDSCKIAHERDLGMDDDGDDWTDKDYEEDSPFEDKITTTQ